MAYTAGKASRSATRFIRLAQQREQPALDALTNSYRAAHDQLVRDIAYTAARAIDGGDAVLMLERQTELLRLVEATMQQYVQQAAPIIDQAAGQQLDLGLRAGAQIMADAGIGAVGLGVNQYAVAAAAGRLSKPVSVYLQQLPRLSRQRAQQMITTGVTLGWHPRRVAREMARTADITHARALVVARTEMLRAYREGNRAQWLDGGQVKGWVWQAALTGRTCPVCWAMNGTYHPISQPLTSHPNCRCTQVPIPDGYTHRVPDPDERFAQLDEATQRRILGPGRHDVWKAGGHRLSDFIEARNDPVYGVQRTVKPVRALRAQAPPKAPRAPRAPAGFGGAKFTGNAQQKALTGQAAAELRAAGLKLDAVHVDWETPMSLLGAHGEYHIGQSYVRMNGEAQLVRLRQNPLAANSINAGYRSTLHHEYGHHLDHDPTLGVAKGYRSRLGMQDLLTSERLRENAPYLSDDDHWATLGFTPERRAMLELMRAMRDSPTMTATRARRWRDGTDMDDAFAEYLAAPEEMFARGMQHWVASHHPDDHDLQAHFQLRGMQHLWTPDEWRVIQPYFDRYARAAGWIRS